MRKILFILLISLMFMGVTIGDSMVQAAVCGNRIVEGDEECDDGNTLDGDGCSSRCQNEPPDLSPDLSVNLRMEFDTGNGAYNLGDFIVPNITVANVGGLDIYVSARAFNEALFHHYIRFIDPDLNEIKNNQLGDLPTEQQEPDLAIINGKPSEPVRLLDSTYIKNSRHPDASADFDGLDRTGRWEAVFELGVRTFLIDDTFLHNGELFAHAEDVHSKAKFVARAIYHVVGDEDGDGYSYSLASADLLEMNDPDVDCDDRIVPGQDGEPGTDDDGYLVNPGMTEICGNEIDDDCNPATLDLWDADGDGYYCNVDCDDADANEHPDQTWYKDADNDGYSDGTIDTASCERPFGYKVTGELTATSVDCNDNNPAINPGAFDIPCNGIDEDCDGEDSVEDADRDTYNCIEDCNDNDPLINPGMTELPGNEIDDDCNPDTLDVEDVCADLDNIGRPSVINMVYMGSGTLPDTVYIIANDRSNWDHSGAFTYFAGVVEKFDNHEFPDRINNMEVDIDGRLSDAGRLSGGLFVHIFNGSSVPVAGVSSSDQEVSFHPSCSDPLFTGDQYGSLLLFDWTGEFEPGPE